MVGLIVIVAIVALFELAALKSGADSRETFTGGKQ